MTSLSPAHRRGKAVDDQMVAAVIKVISSSGTLGIKVEDVAGVAGVNKTTIYRRFSTRDDLVLSACLAQADSNVPIPDGGSLSADALAVARMVRDVVLSPFGKALLSAAEASPELETLRRSFWGQRLSAASVIIERGVERGECSSAVDPNLLIELLLAPIHFRASQIGTEITDEFIDIQVARLTQDIR